MEHRVVIVQKFIPEYRREFFERLRSTLTQRGVQFELIQGNPDPTEATRGYDIYLPWSHYIKNRFVTIKNRHLYWQPLLGKLQRGDLVIVEHASKLLVNYWLHVLHAIGYIRLAYWGHGKNFQGHNETWIAKRIKPWLARSVHWWFCYTSLSVKALSDSGVPQSKVTVVQNAINTDELKQTANSINSPALTQQRQKLGIPLDAPVAAYIGGMYPDKRIDFLLDSLKLTRQKVPAFHAILIGAGIEADKVSQFCEQNTWAHYLGPLQGHEKVLNLKLAECMLMPGAVGLAVLDSFALQLPMITTDLAYHGPEVEYIDGNNGMIVSPSDNINLYVDAVVRVLSDSEYANGLKRACDASAQQYTIDEMVERYATGIERALR